MRLRSRLASLAVLAGLASAFPAAADVHRYILFNGSNVDSTEQASPWINVRGASRVVIRFWSTHAAYSGTGAGDPDSTLADSLGAISVLFSDSLCCVGDMFGQRFDGAADSVAFSFPGNSIGVQGFGDTTRVGVVGWPIPVNRSLRAPSNGSGTICTIMPIAPIFTQVNLTGWQPDWVFQKKFMRIRTTALRRSTSGTSQCGAAGCCNPGCGNRVNGLKGFKATADVYRDGTNESVR